MSVCDYPGEFELAADARMALAQILGIMSAQVTIGIDDRGVAADLDGMAYTEIASADLPWIDMVRWTADFVSSELRQHWADDEWLSIAAA